MNYNFDVLIVSISRGEFDCWNKYKVKGESVEDVVGIEYYDLFLEEDLSKSEIEEFFNDFVIFRVGGREVGVMSFGEENIKIILYEGEVEEELSEKDYGKLEMIWEEYLDIDFEEFRSCSDLEEIEL